MQLFLLLIELELNHNFKIAYDSLYVQNPLNTIILGQKKRSA